MKLWLSAETHADVGDDLRIARNFVEKTINSVIESQAYDIGVEGWDCIIILRDDMNFEEITKFSKKRGIWIFGWRLTIWNLKHLMNINGKGWYFECC